VRNVAENDAEEGPARVPLCSVWKLDEPPARVYVAVDADEFSLRTDAVDDIDEGEPA
jgi:hypothetical protein